MATSQYKNFYIQTQSCHMNGVIHSGKMADSLKVLSNLNAVSEVKTTGIWQGNDTQVPINFPKKPNYNNALKASANGVIGRYNCIDPHDEQSSLVLPPSPRQRSRQVAH